GHRVDVVDIERLDHCALAYIAEQAELAPLLLRDRAIRTTEQNVRLNTDRTQFLYRVLRGLGLEFACAGDERQQCEMDVDGVIARQLVAELADRLEKRQAFDVAYGAADLAQHEVETFVALADEILDRVGDVRNHLDGGAEIVAAAFLGENFLVDAAGGDVVVAGRRTAGEPLVVA